LLGFWQQQKSRMLVRIMTDRNSFICGFAAAQCGKPTAYRSSPFYENAARLSLAAAQINRLAGKAEPYRTGLRQSRNCKSDPTNE
jgi:hypothetical protein